jgi:Transglutaminase-like superfamily
MWEPLQRFRALEPNARGLLLRAAVLLPLISLSLRLCGFRSTQASLKKHITSAASKRHDSTDLAKAERTALIARMVRGAADRSIGGATCLERSLVLWWLLERQGIASSVRIGARKIGPKFEAHAWVECDGLALNDPEEVHEHYAAFDEAFPVINGVKK